MSMHMAVTILWDLLLWRYLVCRYIWQYPSHRFYYYGDTLYVNVYGSIPQVGFTTMEILSMSIDMAIPLAWDLLLWRYLV